MVAEAYRLWLTFDDRTDDITMIVIYFENIKNVGDASEGGAAVNSGNFSPRAGKVQRVASISRGKCFFRIYDCAACSFNSLDLAFLNTLNSLLPIFSHCCLPLSRHVR